MSTSSTISEEQEICVTVKCTTGQKFTVKASKVKTIRDIKELCSEESKVPANNQRLIFKGHVLNDSSTLEKIGFEDGNTLILVKSVSATSKPSASASAAQQPQSQPQQSQNQQQPNNNASGGAAGTGGGMPFNLFSQLGGMGNQDPSSSMNAMLGNPQMMMQMMQNPAVQQMMNNVMQNLELLRQMVDNNPMIQQMANSNPQLQSLLNNPQLMQMAMNPQNLQAAMQMQQMFQQTSAQQQQQQSNSANQPAQPTTEAAQANTTAPNANTTQQQATGQPQQPPVMPNIDFSQIAQMFQGLNTPATTPHQQTGTGTGSGTGTGTATNANNSQPAPASNNPVNPFMSFLMNQNLQQPQNPSQTQQNFDSQLSQLESMGFCDRETNLSVLRETNGNLSLAIERLLNQ